MRKSVENDLAYRKAGNKATVIFADKLKDLGYDYATRAGGRAMLVGAPDR